MTEIEKLFWLKVNILEIDECWNWLGRLDKDTYGIFNFDSKSYRAHRFFSFYRMIIFQK